MKRQCLAEREAEDVVVGVDAELSAAGAAEVVQRDGRVGSWCQVESSRTRGGLGEDEGYGCEIAPTNDAVTYSTNRASAATNQPITSESAEPIHPGNWGCSA